MRPRFTNFEAKITANIYTCCIIPAASHLPHRTCRAYYYQDIALTSPIANRITRTYEANYLQQHGIPLSSFNALEKPKEENATTHLHISRLNPTTRSSTIYKCLYHRTYHRTYYRTPKAPTSESIHTISNIFITSIISMSTETHKTMYDVGNSQKSTQ
ncbi:hypothetical protein BDD12DRAFT_858567 [Trichophaea hybrida]|nr:hypothetical protein BDD12DRAFT_858567 [Trichophaea hybrida]